jgi:hypothetical protein
MINEMSSDSEANLHRRDEFAEAEVPQPLGVGDGPDLEARQGPVLEIKSTAPSTVLVRDEAVYLPA